MNYTVLYANGVEITFHNRKDKTSVAIEALHYALINKYPLHIKRITDENGHEYSVDYKFNFTQTK